MVEMTQNHFSNGFGLGSGFLFGFAFYLSFKKEKYKVIGPKLVVSVIQSAGPNVLSVKRRVFL